MVLAVGRSWSIESTTNRSMVSGPNTPANLGGEPSRNLEDEALLVVGQGLSVVRVVIAVLLLSPGEAPESGALRSVSILVSLGASAKAWHGEPAQHGGRPSVLSSRVFARTRRVVRVVPTRTRTPTRREQGPR